MKIIHSFRKNELLLLQTLVLLGGMVLGAASTAVAQGQGQGQGQGSQPTAISIKDIPDSLIANESFTINIKTQRANNAAAPYTGTIEITSDPAGVIVESSTVMNNISHINIKVRFPASGSYVITASTAPGSPALTSATTNQFNINPQFTPLPVELTTFAAQATESGIDLRWSTASESNNKGFEIQSSANGAEYATVAFVPSNSPDSRSEQQYTYKDKRISKTKILYYRLRQLDLDGKETFSPVVAVRVKSAKTKIAAYPNPFADSFHIALDGLKEKVVQIAVYDMTGRSVYEEEHALRSGTNTIAVNLGEEAADGLYTIEVVDGEAVARSYLVKH